MIRHRYLLLAPLLFSSLMLFSQKKINNLFVNSTENIARLDFSNGSPTVHYTGFGSGANIGEGIAHIENEHGDVVILVNSSGVYDKNGTKMPGSAGILAHPSSTEIVISRKPFSPNLFFVIYNNQLCSSLMYSVVDLSKRNGLGDVVELNLFIDAKNEYAEGLEIVEMPCSSNFILLAYRCYSGFVKFSITSEGILDPEVIHTYQSDQHGGRGELEYRKGKLGYGATFTNKAFLADFDAETGTVSNAQVITFPATNGIYGLEFSATSSKVYVTDLDNRDLFGQTSSPNLFCYDFETAAVSSWTLSNQTACPGLDPQGLGQIEIGKDLRLYIPVINGCKLYVVNNADSYPVIEQIETNFILSAGISDHIKSEFLNEYSSHEPVINAEKKDLVLCPNETINLEVDHDDPSMSFQWYLNDQPIPGARSHNFVASTSGRYSVMVQDQNACALSSSPVVIKPAFTKLVDLGKDTVLCYNDRLILKIDSPDAAILWNDGDASPTKEIGTSGEYSVTVEKNGCIDQDSIKVELVTFDSRSIPNVITPNGDSYNEYFLLPTNLPHAIHLTIFNRWGIEVYSDPDYRNQWNNSSLSDGVYYYEVRSDCLNSKGWIHVVR